jgi:colanic acid/amylovoran biosynthesis glycosyltransferase
MKLALLVPEFPTQTHIFFWREANALRQLGTDVCFVSSRRPAAPCPHAFAREAIPRTFYLFPPRPLPIVRHPFRILKGLSYLSELRSSAWKERLRVAGMSLAAANLVDYCAGHAIDHIHVHSCANTAHVVAMARRMGGPTFSLHLHGDLPVYGSEHRAKMRDALFISADARPHQLQVIDEVGIPADKTCTIHMGVDTDRFAPAAANHGVENPNILRAVSVSRLHPCKGHVYALRAIRRAVEGGVKIHYTIAGGGEAERQIRDEVNRLGLVESVQIVGALDEQQVIELLHRADVFLLTSVGIGEASPVAVMEAMACGVPPICSIIGGTADMIDHGIDGLLVPQQDEIAISEALVELATDPAKRRALSAAARERAVKQFSVNRTARKLIDTIEAHRLVTPATESGGRPQS